MRGLSTEGNLCFKIDRASHTVGRKFTIFALFALYLGAISKLVQAPRGGGGAVSLGGYIWSSLYMEGLIFGILQYVTQPPLPQPPAKRASSKVYIYLTFLFRLVLLQTYSSPYDTSICTEPFICHNLT